MEKPAIVVRVPGAIVSNLWRNTVIDKHSLQYRALADSIWDTHSGRSSSGQDARGTFEDWIVHASPYVENSGQSTVFVDWKTERDYTVGDTQPIAPTLGNWVIAPTLGNWVKVVPADINVEDAVKVMEMFSIFHATDMMAWEDALHAAASLIK
jgi:hypothetical protein